MTLLPATPEGDAGDGRFPAAARAAGGCSGHTEQAAAFDVWRNGLRLHRAWLGGQEGGSRLESNGLLVEGLREPMARLERALFRNWVAPAADLKQVKLQGPNWRSAAFRSPTCRPGT